MKTLGSWVALASVVVVNLSLIAGCGCDSGNNSVRTPLAFTPSSVHALRTPAQCGSATAPYASDDTFTLSLTGDTTGAAPYTTIAVRLPASVALNQAEPLNVSQDSSGSTVTASSNDGSIQFTFTLGSNASEIDSTPLDSVIVTPTSIPTTDGAILGAELRLGFEDGRVLDQVYSSPVQSILVACQ